MYSIHTVYLSELIPVNGSNGMLMETAVLLPVYCVSFIPRPYTLSCTSCSRAPRLTWQRSAPYRVHISINTWIVTLREVKVVTFLLYPLKQQTSSLKSCVNE